MMCLIRLTYRVTVAALGIAVLTVLINNKDIGALNGVNVEIIEISDRLVHLNLMKTSKHNNR